MFLRGGILEASLSLPSLEIENNARPRWEKRRKGRCTKQIPPPLLSFSNFRIYGTEGDDAAGWKKIGKD